jgi:hypothetical protein
VTYPRQIAQHIREHDIVLLDNVECIVTHKHTPGPQTVMLEVWPTDGGEFFPVQIPVGAQIPLVNLYDEY